jgi:hypothetical protein
MGRRAMTAITDEFMREMIGKTKPYSVVILKAGPNRGMEGVEKLVWEHGRRNFALRAEGVLAIALPISDGTEVNGIGIFNAGVQDVRRLMDEDPGVKEGVFVYEIHQSRSFPGDRLPA